MIGFLSIPLVRKFLIGGAALFAIWYYMRIRENAAYDKGLIDGDARTTEATIKAKLPEWQKASEQLNQQTAELLKATNLAKEERVTLRRERQATEQTTANLLAKLQAKAEQKNIDIQKIPDAELDAAIRAMLAEDK